MPRPPRRLLALLLVACALADTEHGEQKHGLDHDHDHDHDRDHDRDHDHDRDYDHAHEYEPACFDDTTPASTRCSAATCAKIMLNTLPKTWVSEWMWMPPTGHETDNPGIHTSAPHHQPY